MIDWLNHEDVHPRLTVASEVVRRMYEANCIQTIS